MMEAKYIIFFAGSIITVPAGILIATQSRKFHDFIFMFLVFGTCMPTGLFGFPTDINFLSREWYRGTTRGVEISYLDLIAVILLVSSLLVRQREGRRFFWPPGLGTLLAYLCWCAFTIAAFSDPKIFGLFELTKIARAILLFVAVSAYIRSAREVHIFVWALAGTILYEAYICLRDRYVFGMHRIRGTLGHPNSLSMYSLQIIPVMIGAFFSADTSKRLRVACILGYVAAAGCVLLTISRTGFAALILLSGASLVLCTGLRMSPRNFALASVAVVAMALMVARSYDTTMSRLGGFDLEREYMSEEGDRGQYFRQGGPAVAENPITGFGLNNWSWWISAKYGPMAGFPMTPYPSTNRPNDDSAQTAPAHNLYLLTVAELGWPGFFLFIAVFLQSIWFGISTFFGKRGMLIQSVRIGGMLSLVGVMLQSWTEWEFRQTSMFFLGHIVMAVVATLYYHREPARRD